MTSAADYLPSTPTLDELRAAAEGCRGCPLYACATRVVFGEGPADAVAMFVGDAPTAEEGRAGRPFLGPPGRLLGRALAEVGIDRTEVYVTNVVKHARGEPRGRRRTQCAPDDAHVAACRPWLDAELAVVRPAVLVCLGAAAARAVLGEGFRVRRQRGVFLPSPLAPHVLATVHPSAVLRARGEEARRVVYTRFVDDLARVAERLRAVHAGV